jgi:hypothetical protein
LRTGGEHEAKAKKSWKDQVEKAAFHKPFEIFHHALLERFFARAASA